MQKLITIWFLSFFFLQMTQANNNPLPINGLGIESAQDFSCNLAPPSTFYASSIGTTNVVLNWTSVSGAGGYEIRAFQGGTQYGATATVGAGVTTFNFDGLQPGQTYDFRIWTKCQNGERGGTYREVTATTIIIEFIAQIENPCSNIGQTIFTNTGTSSSYNAPIDWIGGSSFWGELSYQDPNNTSAPMVYLVFRVELPSGPNSPAIIAMSRPESTLPGSGMCVLDQGVCYEPIHTGESMRMLQYAQQIGKFTIAKPGGFGTQGVVSFSEMPVNAGFTMKLKQRDCPGFGGGSIDNSANYAFPTGTVNNPFHDLLIYNSETLTDDDVTLSLMDMNGRILRTQKMAGGQDQYSLQTADITPGMYVLRVQTGKQVKVMQVVKTN
jgi:hypothetical protein